MSRAGPRNRGFGGLPVFSLTLVWLAGRTAFALAPFCSLPVLAALELAFLPLLIALIAPPIIRERNRNIAMLAVLAALWIADAVFLLALARADAALASRALLTAMNIVLLLLTIVGGRILPAFTSNALRRTNAAFSLHRYAWLETTAAGRDDRGDHRRYLAARCRCCTAGSRSSSPCCTPYGFRAGAACAPVAIRCCGCCIWPTRGCRWALR